MEYVEAIGCLVGLEDAGKEEWLFGGPARSAQERVSGFSAH